MKKRSHKRPMAKGAAAMVDIPKAAGPALYTSEQVRRALAIRDKQWADTIFPFIDMLCRIENRLMDVHNAGPGFPKTYPLDLIEFFMAPPVKINTARLPRGGTWRAKK